MKTKIQSFKVETIQRSMIVNADYNPRKISDKNAKALRKSLKTFGLVEPLIWNKKTGNLVGGHQRLHQIDSIEKTKEYDIDVSVIEVDIKTEKELNIALNNSDIQGEYDFDILTNLLGEINVENTGFDQYSLSIMGVDIDVNNTREPEKADIKEEIEKIKEAKKRSKEKNLQSGENYIVVTFSSVDAKESFLEKFNHEVDDRYIKGEILLSYIEKIKEQ